MEKHQVTLRPMTTAEYDQASLRREAESVRELSKFLPEDQARERVRHATARFLPNGAATEGHDLIVAVNARGKVVGDAWIGPDPNAATGSTASAWLYDLNVHEPFRRHGYVAMLSVSGRGIAMVRGRRGGSI